MYREARSKFFVYLFRYFDICGIRSYGKDKCRGDLFKFEKNLISSRFILLIIR